MNRIRVSLPILMAGLLVAGPIGAQTAPAKANAKADARLEAAAKKVDAKTSAEGEAAVAARLAARFGGTAEAMLAEQDRLDVSWGQLMIAHALDQNVAAAMTVEQLVELRSEATGWGQVAAGLGLELGSVVRSMDRETRVATGQLAANARFEPMKGAAATAGLGADAKGAATLGASATGAASAAGATAGVTTGLGAGVGLPLGR